jgi:iron complex outermembrane receptor protein
VARALRLQAPLRHGQRRRHRSALDPVGRQQSERVTGSLSWAEPQVTRDLGLGASLSTQQYSQEMPTWYRLLPPGLAFPTGAFPNGMIAAPETWERTYRFRPTPITAACSTTCARRGPRRYRPVPHARVPQFQLRRQRHADSAAGVVETTYTTPFLRPQRRKIDYIYLQDEWNFAADWA